MKFTVERSRWFRGGGGPNSFLLRADGQMCCLGFRALASGLKPEDIRGIRMPSGTFVRWSCAPTPTPTPPPEWGKFVDLYDRIYDTDVCVNISNVNDDRRLSPDRREAKLKELFASVGDEVEFVDELANKAGGDE